MRRLGQLTSMVLLFAGLGDAGGLASKPVVSACMSPTVYSLAVVRAKVMATGIFDRIGIRLLWRLAGDDCIQVQLVDRAPEDIGQGTLAVARPFSDAGATVYLDRVGESVPHSLIDTLLAHTLVHEIVHILQGTAEHSTSGIMKSRWENGDYKDMIRGRLVFEARDVDRLQRGLAKRVAHNSPTVSAGDSGGGM